MFDISVVELSCEFLLLWLPRALMACYDGSKAGQSALSLSSCSPLPVPSSKSGMDIYTHTRLEGGQRGGNGLWSYLLTRRAHGAKQARKKQNNMVRTLSPSFHARKKNPGVSKIVHLHSARVEESHARRPQGGRSEPTQRDKRVEGAGKEKLLSLSFLRSQHGISYKKERRV